MNQNAEASFANNLRGASQVAKGREKSYHRKKSCTPINLTLNSFRKVVFSCSKD